MQLLTINHNRLSKIEGEMWILSHYKSIVCLFVLVYGVSFATPQTVDVTFDSPVVRVNSFATARCIIRDAVAQIQSFRWEKDGSLIVFGADRFSITMIDSSSSRLEIEPTELDDSGEYSCSVSFMGGGLIADSADLRVATELILTADLEQEFTMTTTATLRCSARSSPAPRIIWSRVVDENTVNVLDQQFPEDQDFGTFTISDVSESDAGTYRCTARTSLDEESVDIELIVLVHPRIITSSSTLQVISDTTLVFNCSATGMRPPTYHWLHDNLNIANIIREDDRIIADNITGSLIIRNVTFTDAGIYTCVATNSAGSDRQDNELTVFGPPAIILSPSDLDQGMVRVAEGTRIVLNCPFLSNPPSQFTRWRNINNDIIIPTIGGRFEDFPNGTLVISVVRAQDSGNYTCEIRNDFGTSTFTYNLVALVDCGDPQPPVNGIINSYSSTIEGAQITFQCNDDPVNVMTSVCNSTGVWEPDPAMTVPRCQTTTTTTTTTSTFPSSEPTSGGLSTGATVAIALVTCFIVGFVCGGVILIYIIMRLKQSRSFHIKTHESGSTVSESQDSLPPPVYEVIGTSPSDIMTHEIAHGSTVSESQDSNPPPVYDRVIGTSPSSQETIELQRNLAYGPLKRHF